MKKGDLKMKKSELKQLIKEVYQQILKEEQGDDLWSKAFIMEFLDLIGQDDQKFKSDTEGISKGDYGLIKFITDYTQTSLFLTFQDETLADTAFNALSQELTNPYEFGRNKTYIPQTIIVTFTKNE